MRVLSFIAWALILSGGLIAKPKEADTKASVEKFLTEYRSLFGSGKAQEIDLFLGKSIKEKMGPEMSKNLADPSVPKSSRITIQDLVEKNSQVYVKWTSDQTQDAKEKPTPWYRLEKGGPKSWQIQDIQHDFDPRKPGE
jgi:hypothetical protein